MNLKCFFSSSIIIVILIGCTNSTVDNQVKMTEINNHFNSLEKDIQLMSESATENKKIIEELNNRIHKLEQDNKNLKENINIHNKAFEQYIDTHYIAESFIAAYISGDIKTMQSLVSDKFTINSDYISYYYEDQEIKLNIVDKKMEFKLDTYHYDQDSAFYSFMVYEEPSIGVLNSFFIQFSVGWNGMWEIEDIVFDI